MEDEKVKDPDQVVADSMTRLFGGLGAAVANTLAATNSKAFVGRFRVEGRVLREDGSPVVGITLGLAGKEAITDDQGRFEMLIEKK
jgi:hypothetical protein